jgi:hypothetical protein
MVRRWRLYLGVPLTALLIGLVPSPAQAARSGDCTGAGLFIGCPAVDASVGPDQVDLIGTATSPGSSGDGRNAGKPIQGGAAGRADSCADKRADVCHGNVPRGGVPAAATAPTPSLTLRDLAAFRPAPGTQQMQPNGWVVPGLDANFYAIVGQQLVPGTLLGQSATVRFTPVAYHWNYGDGTAAIRATKGGTWAQLGLADFDATPTSHVYEAEGEYVIRLTIDFRAEYRLGSAAFRPVIGTISLPANELRVTVTGAKTVLVDHDCVANPAGPGC